MNWEKGNWEIQELQFQITQFQNFKITIEKINF